MGGTIGMTIDPVTGALRPVRGLLTSSLDTILRGNSRFPRVQVYESPEPLDSSDMGPADWAEIAHLIAARFSEFDGFVVVQGTDTLAYSASALSFMLENLSKPVVLTGAMLPMGRSESDAPRNLLVSILVAATSMIPEVCVFFRDQLLRGCALLLCHRLLQPASKYADAVRAYVMLQAGAKSSTPKASMRFFRPISPRLPR